MDVATSHKFFKEFILECNSSIDHIFELHAIKKTHRTIVEVDPNIRHVRGILKTGVKAHRGVDPEARDIGSSISYFASVPLAVGIFINSRDVLDIFQLSSRRV